MISAQRLEFLVGHFRTAAHVRLIAAPECEMAGRVLVKERFEEQHAFRSDRRRIRHQCAFAEVTAAFVGIEDRLQGFLALSRVKVHDCAVPERQCEVFDEIALIGKRQRRLQHAFRPQAVRHREHFFRRHVRKEPFAVRFVNVRAAFPAVVFHETDREIRPEGVRVMQGVELPFRQALRTHCQVVGVRHPLREGVAVADPDGRKNRVPKAGHCHVRVLVREDLSGPGPRRDCGNVPLEAHRGLHFVILLQCLVHGADVCGKLFHVGALQGLGVIADEVDESRVLLRISVQPQRVPFRKRLKQGLRRIVQFHPHRHVVQKLRHDFRRAFLVGILRHEPAEFIGFHRAGDRDPLALSYVNASLDKQTRIRFFFLFKRHYFLRPGSGKRRPASYFPAFRIIYRFSFSIFFR